MLDELLVFDPVEVYVEATLATMCPSTNEEHKVTFAEQ